MKILVTGGAGFIGTHLVELLLEDPTARVTVIDDLRGTSLYLPAFRAELERNPRLRSGDTRVEFELCSVAAWFSRRPPLPADEVYHLASIVGPVGVLAHAGEIVRQTVLDTYAVMDYSRTVNARLCLVSTSEVYGGGAAGLCGENENMIFTPEVSIRQEYAVAKLASEVAARNHCRANGLPVTIVRPFNVAGPRQSEQGGFVLPRFLRQALTGEPLTVYGEGKSIRAFTHVRDVADGIVRVQREGKPGEPYNLGNPENRIPILDLARKVIQLTGSPSSVSFVDPKKLWGPLFAEAHDKFPDAGRAMLELGWQPRRGLEQIILETADYIVARLAHPWTGK